MKKSLLKKYARLIAVTGAAIQPGQEVVINASVDQYPFVTLVVEECYKAGASLVRIEWGNQEITKLHYAYQTLETLSTVPEWKKVQLEAQVKTLPAHIHIVSDDPAGMAGVDREKMVKARQAQWPILKPINDAMESRYQWIIAATPSTAWAKKVFPELAPAKAVEKLWTAILDASRVTEDNDPIEAWKEHDSNFRARCAWLNEKAFDTVTYHSANGTDFKAELIPEGQWCGGGEETMGGVFFNPNIPTEEIFTSPMAGKAEGTLVSTKPLSYQGQLIENFRIIFRDGKAVEWHAEKGEELLTQMITMDEGACKLGELALVPMSSPICKSGILYYETLFDENASCHVALGRGFNDCIKDYQQRSDEECKALGINDSMIHVDFMIGVPDLCITGWKNGEPTPIFVNGEWAF